MSKAKNKKEIVNATKDNLNHKSISKPRLSLIFDWKPILVLSIFAFILYSNTLNHDYALDDAIVITNNQFTQKGKEGISEIFKYDTFVGFWLTSYKNKTAEQIQEEKKLVAGGRYRPLSLATFALEVEYTGKNIKDASEKVVYKGNPFVSHLNNILLYLATVIMLYFVLKRLFPPDEERKWYLSFPFIVSLLFMAHPIHTEAVANIKGRDEIMTLLGSLSALWFTIRYLDTKKTYYLILSSVSLFLGLLSKENAITFLAVIPLSIYYFTNHNIKNNLLASIPLFGAAAIFLLIRGSVLGIGGHQEEITSEIMNNPFIHATFGEKMATIFYTLWMYVRLLFYPNPLTYDYYPNQIEIINWSNPGAFLPFILYMAMGVFAVHGLINKKDVFSWSIWLFLLPLSVVSNIFFPVGTFMNERFVFISSLGFCVLIGWLIYKYLPLLIKNIQTSTYVSTFILVVVLGLYSFKTIDRNKAWKNDLSLFTTDVQTSVNSAKSNCSAGGKLIEEAQKPENNSNKIVHDQMVTQAIVYLERAIEIYPNYIDALNLLGNAHFELNFDMQKSLYYYAKVLKINQTHVIANGNARIVLQNAVGLLTAKSTNNTPDNIIEACRDIIVVQPQFGEAYHMIGTMYGKYKKELDSALLYLEKANLCNFDKTASFFRDLGVAYGMSGNFQPALENFLKAIELDPNDFQTYFNAGLTYQQLGQMDKANFYINKSQELKQKQPTQ